MKTLKHKHKVTYTKHELNIIADKFNSEESKYELFRNFIWDSVLKAASLGKYITTLDVSSYSNEYLNKIMDELLRNNMMCNSYESEVHPYFESAMYRNGINAHKILEVCWNSNKAYSQ